MTLTLQNVGGELLTLSDLAITGDPSFTMVDAPTLPIDLAPSAYTTVTVQALSETAGSYAASLDVTVNDPRGVVSAPFTSAPADTAVVTDTFPVPVDPPVDIVIAVDQSASMDDDAIALGANFKTFIDTIQAETGGWRLGVVTWDTACFNHGALTASTPSVGGLFADAVTQGEDREITDDEHLLQLLSRALDQTAPGSCNEDFLRPEALLHLIVVSDEPERSPEEATGWTWDHWLDEYAAYKTSAALIKVSGVVDLDGCGEGAAGYEEAIAASAGEALSICAGTWDAYAAALGRASTTSLWSFSLSDTPVVSTLAVSVDGATVASGWRYDADANAVTFDTTPGGATVTVSYHIAAECP